MGQDSADPPFPSASTHEVRVLYADTDRMGVVYYGTYFRWFEAGRAGYMRERGTPYGEVERSGILLPVVEAHAAYRLPARYDDLLDVRSRVARIGRAQLEFEYEIRRGDELLVTGYTRHASINDSGRPTRLPDWLKDTLVGPRRACGEGPSREEHTDAHCETD